MIFQQIWFLIYSLKFNKKNTYICQLSMKKHIHTQKHRDTHIGIFWTKINLAG